MSVCVRQQAWIFAVCVLVTPALYAQTVPSMPSEEIDRQVAWIAAEATARSASGMPEADVEAWMQNAMRQAGLAVRAPPASWDVYGQAHWDREAALAHGASPESSEAGAETPDAAPDTLVFQPSGSAITRAGQSQRHSHDTGSAATGPPE